MLGRLVHIGFDAVLISVVLAGIKRSTGLTCVPPFPFPSAIARIKLKSTCLVLYYVFACSPALTQVFNKDVRRE